jgi:hypothetical protein
VCPRRFAALRNGDRPPVVAARVPRVSSHVTHFGGNHRGGSSLARHVKRHVYTFATFSLKPGKYVYIRTGRGTDTSTSVYQGRGWYVWNNTADKVSLRTAAGTTVDTCQWTHAGSGQVAC